MKKQKDGQLGQFDEFHSLNGGISMCMKALAGILISHGLAKTVSSVNIATTKEEGVSGQNDLIFLGFGFESIDAIPLEDKIESAAKHYKTYVGEYSKFFSNKISLQQNERRWHEVALRAKSVILEFGEWCNTEHIRIAACVKLGIPSPLTRIRFLNWSELDLNFYKFFGSKHVFEEKAAELYNFLADAYVNDEIPDGFRLYDLKIAIDSVINEFDEFNIALVKMDALWRDVDASRLRYISAFSELVQELSKLPHSAQLGLFRTCSPKFLAEGHFPSLFGLNNIKPPEL